MGRLKTLYKLARNKLFEKIYFCVDCSKLDPKLLEQNKEYLHDEHNNVIRMFMCKKCQSTMKESEIIYHHIRFEHF